MDLQSSDLNIIAKKIFNNDGIKLSNEKKKNFNNFCDN